MTGTAGPPPYDAVVLAGGSARRLGGVDKPAQQLGDRMLLDRVLQAVGDADRIVVVGPSRTTSVAVTWTREEPPGSGPLPALAAGLAAVAAPLVLVLAADLPFLCADVVSRLLAAVSPVPAAGDPSSGAVLIDDTGACQWLVGAWRSEPLRRALPKEPSAGAGSSLRAVMRPLAPLAVHVDSDGGPPPWYDCDTLADMARAQAWT